MPTLADEYQQQYRWRHWTSAYAALPVAPGQRILDLGCAVGDQSRALAALGNRVIGVDANPELLAVARGRGGADVEFHLGDLRDLSALTIEPVDGLWISFVAAYFFDLAAQLRRWCEHLRPGGWIALVEVDDLLGQSPLDDTTQDAVRRYYALARQRGTYDFRMGARLHAEAEAAGLIVERELVVPDDELSFDGAAGPEVLEAWRRRLDRLGLLGEVCGEGIGAFRASFLEALTRPDHRSHGRVHLVLARMPAP